MLSVLLLANISFKELSHLPKQLRTMASLSLNSNFRICYSTKSHDFDQGKMDLQAGPTEFYL